MSNHPEHPEHPDHPDHGADELDPNGNERERASARAARSDYLRNVGRMTAAVGLVVSILAWLVFGFALTLGVVFGAAMTLLNFWLLVRVLGEAVERVEDYRGRTWVLPVALLLKWPVTLVVLALVLRYTPARPEGVILGVLIVLLCASWAAAPRPSKRQGST